MIARASGALLFAYIILAIAGLVFLFVPSPTLENVATTSFTVIVWGMFYLVGGVLASTCIVARKFIKNTTPLWYFEMAGNSLIIAANLVYTYALASQAYSTGQYNIYATALVILAFSGGLVARSIETLRLVRVLKQFSQDGDIKNG